MPGDIYRYFRIYERDISQIIGACDEDLREYREKSEEILSKYGLYKYMIYRNAIRSERARKRGIDDPAEQMDVLVLFKRNEYEIKTEAAVKASPEKAESLKAKLKKKQKVSHPGFTSVSGASSLLNNDYTLYKVDLRKREGKEIFSEFMELYALNPEDIKPYQYIAKCFGLQHSLVPNIPAKAKSRFSYYETYGERFGTGTGAYWLFAVPVHSPKYAAMAHSEASSSGLGEDYSPQFPVAELDREEYTKLWDMSVSGK